MVAIDAGRLDRAIHLSVQPLGGRRYLVTGGARPHLVNLAALVPCRCEDRPPLGCACKHVLAAQIVERDPEVFSAAQERVREIAA